MATRPKWGLSPTGYYRPSLEEILDRLITSFERELRSRGIEDWQQSRDPTSPMYIQFSAFAAIWDEIWAFDEESKMSMIDPTVAVGRHLDAIARVNGISRLPQARSIATLQLTGNIGTRVPRGTRFRGQAYDHILESLVDVEFTEAGPVSVKCQSLLFGERPIANPVVLVNPINGLLSASVTSYSPGRLTETDPELRSRMYSRQARFMGGTGTRNAIINYALSVPGVAACDVIINSDDGPDEEGRPGHSWEAIIYPAVDEELIGPVLLSQVTPGIGTVGSEEYVGTDANGREDVVRWSVADAVPIKVKITGMTAIGGGSAVALEPAVRVAVANYINQRQVGESISYTRLVGAVVSVMGVADAEGVEVARLADSFGSTGIPVTYREKVVVEPPLSDISFA